MKNNNKKNIERYLAVVGLLIFLHYTRIISPLETGFVKIFNPVFSVFYTFSTDLRIRVGDMNKKNEMIKTERVLKNEIRELTEESAKLKIVEKENRLLRNYLNFFTKTKYEYKMCNVISRDSISLIGDGTDSLTINKGIKDGVFDGLAVVSGQGVIIGKVEKASDNFSKVCLANSDNCKFAVTILNDTEPSGLTEGDLGLTIKMNLIPQDKIINKGDIVVTSGLEKHIPNGLVIGRVIEVDKNDNEPWQNATIEPIIDSGELTIVSVLLPHK